MRFFFIDQLIIDQLINGFKVPIPKESEVLIVQKV